MSCYPVESLAGKHLKKLMFPVVVFVYGRVCDTRGVDLILDVL